MSLTDKFRVAIAPISIKDGDKEANLSAVEVALKSMPRGTDLLVLPELFSTGYIADQETADSLAETTDGPTMSAIKELATKYKAAICGSFLACNEAAEDSDGVPHRVFNRAFFAEPRGDVAYYDKRHLFILGEEAKIFTPGTQLSPVIRFRGWNFSLAVCYDVRFPVWLRNTNNKYDALVVPANWPDRRATAWTRLLQARAIENEAYVIGANRSGEDEFGNYDGLSYVYDYFGNTIGENKDGLILAELDKTLLNQVREKFPAWKDADTFRILY